MRSEDQFNTVLDRLIEQTKKNGRDEGAIEQAQKSQRDAWDTAHKAESDLKAIGELNARALPKLSELHTAAHNCLPHIGDAGSPELAKQAYDRLKKAIAEAGQYCDEIPF